MITKYYSFTDAPNDMGDLIKRVELEAKYGLEFVCQLNSGCLVFKKPHRKGQPTLVKPA